MMMNPPTILVVEDSALNRKLVETVLKPHGYRVILAENGQDGVEVALREKPDLILMDVMMPVMNGYEATQQIKRQSDMAAVPIVALTASAMPHERERAMQAGCDGYITKPIDTRAFLGQVKEFLQRDSR
jgi:two-component system cell cycle response regulator DivK